MIIFNLVTLALALPFLTNLTALDVHPIHTHLGASHQTSRHFHQSYQPDGVLATRKEFPFNALLGWPISFTPTGELFTYRPFCGGSIITRFHVVTSAQCIATIPKGTYQVDSMFAVLGAYDRHYRMAEELRIPVKRIDPHPFYVGVPDYLNDIALVTLSMEIRYHAGVLPICLPQPTFNAYSGSHAVTQVGWQNGGIVSDGFLPRKLDTFSMDIATCQLYWRVTTGQLCTYSKMGAFCRAESGGPVVMEKDGFFMLVGVQSVVTCNREKPIVNTAVPGYVKWIMKTINETKPEAFTDLCLK